MDLHLWRSVLQWQPIKDQLKILRKKDHEFSTEPAMASHWRQLRDHQQSWRSDECHNSLRILTFYISTALLIKNATGLCQLTHYYIIFRSYGLFLKKLIYLT